MCFLRVQKECRTKLGTDNKAVPAYLNGLSGIVGRSNLVESPTGDDSLHDDLCSFISEEVKVNWQGVLVLEMRRKEAFKEDHFKSRCFSSQQHLHYVNCTRIHILTLLVHLSLEVERKEYLFNLFVQDRSHSL